MKLRKSLRHYDFPLPAERKKRGEKVGATSTFFPLLFHRGNPKTHCDTSEIRSASTKLNPPPHHRALPTVRAVSPLCREILFVWRSNPKAAKTATVGRFRKILRFAPAGAWLSQTLVWGKQSVWLSACRTPAPEREYRAAARTHFTTQETEELNVRKPKTKPNLNHPGDGR